MKCVPFCAHAPCSHWMTDSYSTANQTSKYFSDIMESMPPTLHDLRLKEVSHKVIAV